MALVTIQRSPSPSNSQESELADGEGAEGGLSLSRHRRSRSALKRLRKFFHTVRFISKLRPCFSESYFAVKGAALVLPQSECARRVTKSHGGHGDIQAHLQSMFYLLRPQDTIKVAVKLESVLPNRNRYLAVVSCNGKQDTEESVVLGIDCNSETTIGLVLAIWSFTQIKLDGDGGFLISNKGRHHIFKPVSVQVMWSALQCLYKVINLAVKQNYIPSGLTHTWVGYYKNKISSNHASIVEWHAMEDVETNRLETLRLAEDDKSQGAIKVKISNTLKEVMMSVDLDEATSKFLRTQLEERLNMDLAEFKSFIDQEMLTILGQMDAPSKIFDYLYLGTEWNASNLSELRDKKIGYILNITREIDNIFPESFNYMNIREYDVEGTNLLKHWERTHKFISEAKRKGINVLVHCKMGVSRSASTVIAYAMKEYNWSLSQAINFVRSKRSCTNPNAGFMQQLETYQGILNASNQRHIFKSRSQQNLTEPSEDEDEDDRYLDIGQQCSAPIHLVHSWTPGESFHQNMEEAYKDDYPEGQKSLRAPLFDNWQDFEISSRSADSTEDSWPDMPSPKKDKPVIQGCSDNDLDWTPPPKIFTIEPEEDSLASNSSSPKDEECLLSADSLSTDNNFFSDETSMSKFKPDGSWIKMAALNTTLPDDDVQLQFIDSPEEFEDREVMQLLSPSIPELSEPESSILPENDGNDETVLQMVDVETSVVEEEGDDTKPDIGVKELYVKEEIPWFPGTVRKQTQDLEEKLKRNSLERGRADYESSDTCSISSEGNKDNSSLNEVQFGSSPRDVSCDTITGETSVTSIDITCRDSVIDDDDATEETTDVSCHETKAEEADVESHDGLGNDVSFVDVPVSENTVASETLPSAEHIDDKEVLGQGDVQMNREDNEATAAENSVWPTTVYDLEEIPFEPGSVRKTTQKIEELHRSVSSDHLNASDPKEQSSKPVQRSSSLKTQRVGPNARDELEQRILWTPIILPNAIRTEGGSTDLSMAKKDDVTDDDNQNDTAMSQSPRQRSASVSATEDGRTVLYKCGSEEIPLLPGLVKRQTQDFENLTSDVESKIVDPSIHLEAEQSVSQSTDMLETGANNVTTTSTPPDEMQTVDVKTHNSMIDPETECAGIDVCEAQVQSTLELVPVEQKNNIKDLTIDANTLDKSAPNVSIEQPCHTQTESQTQSVAKPSMFPNRGAKTASNAPPFTKETLTLIREIGAALLNCPVKADPDEGSESGPSAVRYLTHKFEKRSRKDKVQKSIVIVDKDKQEKQRARYGQPSVSREDSAEQSIESKASPISEASNRTDSKNMERNSTTVIQPNSLCEQDTKKDVHVIRSDLSWGLNPVELQKGKCRTVDSPAQSVINDTSSSPPSQSALTDAKSLSPGVDDRSLKGQMFGDLRKTEEPQSAPVNTTDSPGTNLLSPAETLFHPEQVKTTKSGQYLSRSSSRSLDLPKGLPSCVDRVFGDDPVKSVKQSTCVTERVPNTTRPKSAESMPWRRQYASVQMHDENADVTQSRKIRKLHGKSHPLTKLEGRTTNSLYNTM